jgi:hypothetical protein
MAGSWIITRLQDKEVANFRQTEVLSFCIDSMRFKCQGLLDEAAIASCIMRVDIDPIRACGKPGTSPVFPFRTNLRPFTVLAM